VSYRDKMVIGDLREELDLERLRSQNARRQVFALLRERANESLASLLHGPDLEVETHVTVRPRERV